MLYIVIEDSNSWKEFIGTYFPKSKYVEPICTKGYKGINGAVKNLTAIVQS